MATIAERVQRGIEWLEREHPGWLKKIDLETLDMNDCQICVIGQLTGGFDQVVTRGHDFSTDSGRMQMEQAIRLGFAEPMPDGFSVTLKDSDKAYGRLTVEWRRQIESRRAAREQESKHDPR